MSAAAFVWNERERVHDAGWHNQKTVDKTLIRLIFNILLAQQTQNFHEEKPFLVSV